MLLIDLWNNIPVFEALEQASILASECHVTNTLVRHRYIILELDYESEKFWIRLDRRLGRTSLLAFIFSSSTSSAHDTARHVFEDSAQCIQIMLISMFT